MHITSDIHYIGTFDNTIDLFEAQYPVPQGISYNSYLIIDERVAVFDTADAAYVETWLARLADALGDRKPDYLIVQHMEPDHSAGIVAFAARYPDATIVASQKAFAMMMGFFGSDFAARRLVVGEGQTLSLGKHTLHFIAAPMVHWPEVMMTYDDCDHILFSADGFGRFGDTNEDTPWDDEARRYYIGIVGKYGAQVANVLKKAGGLSIEKICPLHGPVLTKNIPHYLALYAMWSTYQPETDGVVIAYTSIYGNTRRAAELLRDILQEKGQEVALFDLARTHISYAVAEAFRARKLVLASTTYNADVFPPMRAFIHGLLERNYQGRTVALIENGSWAPMAAKVMGSMLEGAKGLTLLPTVTLRGGLSADTRVALSTLALELTK